MFGYHTIPTGCHNYDKKEESAAAQPKATDSSAEDS